MIIDGKAAKKIVVHGSDGEVLAVIYDDRVIEKEGASVIVDWS